MELDYCWFHSFWCVGFGLLDTHLLHLTLLRSQRARFLSNLARLTLAIPHHLLELQRLKSVALLLCIHHVVDEGVEFLAEVRVNGLANRGALPVFDPLVCGVEE